MEADDLCQADLFRNAASYILFEGHSQQRAKSERKHGMPQTVASGGIDHSPGGSVGSVEMETLTHSRPWPQSQTRLAKSCPVQAPMFLHQGL